MKVELKLYKTFDADLISLSSNGISISALIKTALFHYARGETTRFYVPECKSFDLEGRKRFIHIAVNIDDPTSIDFLKHQLKPRQRAAFLRTLIRECLVTQQLGAFLKNESWIKKETDRMRQIDLSTIDNVVELKFDERKHDYISKIIKPAGTTPTPVTKTEKKDEKPATSNRFGDVSDLAIKEEKEKVTAPAASAKPVAKPIETAPEPVIETKPEAIPETTDDSIPEDELPLVDTGVGANFFDEEDEDEPALDDELFAQFQNLTNG